MGLCYTGLAVETALAGNNEIGPHQFIIEGYGIQYDVYSGPQLALKKGYQAASQPSSGPRHPDVFDVGPRSRLTTVEKCRRASSSWATISCVAPF